MSNIIAARLHARMVVCFRSAKLACGIRTLGLIGFAFASIFVSTTAMAVPFTPGNVVVYRVGDGSAALSGNATAAFLDEYTGAGVLVQSVALPTAGAGANKRCVSSGTATSEGLMTLSVDGKYLVGACYDTALATASITTSAATIINRVIFRADSSSSVDTSTALTDFASGASPRSAASTDGSALWFGGGSGGVRYATLGSTTSTQLSTTTTNIRATEIFGGQLYISTASGSIRVGSVGSGLPTTSGQTIVNLPGTPTTTGSPYPFVLLNLGGGAGVDTLYVADDAATGGVTKYSLVAGTWTSNGVIGNTSGYRGLTASASGSTVTLYAVGAAGTNAGKLVAITDATGYNVAPSTATVTVIASAPTNTAFRGIAFAPTAGTPPTGTGNANPNTLNIGDTTLLTVAVTQGNPASAITSVTVDLSAFGGSATQTLYDDGSHGDAAAGNGTYSLNFTIPNGTTGGAKTVNAVIKDAAGRTSTAVPINFTVNAPTPISATGAANPSAALIGGNVLLTVTVTPGTNPTSSAVIVTADLSPIGGLNNQNFYDDGSNGDVTAGDNTFSYLASIPSVSSFAGTKTITANISDAQLRTATATITLTIGEPHSIMEIQGRGARSAYAGSGATLGTTYVTTPSAGRTNVVTAVGSKGFFMQDIAGDGDPTTSDAVFVFTSTAPTVNVGDYVSVTGRVQEFNGSTEIAGTPSVSVISSGHALPTPYNLSANLPTTSSSTGVCMSPGTMINPVTDGYQASNFACLDGMYIAIGNGLVAAPGNGSGGDGIKSDTIPKGFYATAGNPRGFREPGLAFDDTHIGGPTTGTGNPTYAGPIFDGNPEEFQVFMTGLNTAFPYTNYLYNAGQHFSLTGVIQGFVATGSTTITYEAYPITLTTGATPTYPVAVATSAPGKLTVGSQNGLHFFNNTADGADTSAYTDSCAGTGTNDTCPTLAQYQMRLNKMSLQIRTVLKAPVVQVMQEVENYSVATDIANKLHADDATLTYVPYLIPGNDPGGINIAMLVRSGVTVNSVTQIYANATTSACSSPGTCLLNDRPPLLLDATYQGYHFRVLAIYDRSLLNLGVAGKDYVGQKRREQAEQVATIVNTLQTTGANLPLDNASEAGNAQQDASGVITPARDPADNKFKGNFPITGDATVPVIVVGDFNAYEFSDGFVDVTGTIMGTVDSDPSHSIYPPTGTYVAPSPALFDTGAAANPADHYSYTFNGYAQEIDHILLTQPGHQDFIAISNAHGNADVSGSSPDVTDGTTARRVSDHDGQVVTLGYAVTAIAGAGGSVDKAMATVGNGGNASFTFTPNPGYTASVASSSCPTATFNAGTGAYGSGAVTADCTVSVTFAFASSTALALTAGTSPSDSGQSLTFTATVTGVAPTGQVTFYDGATPLCTAVNLSGTMAACTTNLSGAGSHAITAVYSGDTNNATSTSTVLTQQVNAVLSVSIGTPINVTCNGGSNGSLTAIAANGTTPYSYSWSPSGGTAATASGLAAGDYTVTVTDGVSTTAQATATVSQPAAIAVSPATLPGGTVQTAYSQSISASGGNAGGYIFSTASTLPAGLSLATNGVLSGTPTATGTYPIVVTATDPQGCGGSSPTYTVTIGKANQALTFGPQSPASHAFVSSGTFPINPLATSAAPNSGNAITYSSLTAGVCSVSGTTVTMLGTGTCTVAADQLGDGNYNAATQVQQNVAIGVASQTISSFIATPASPTFASGGTFTVSATGGASGNPVTFSIAPASASVCSAGGSNGATITMLAAGTCTVHADQAGNANYAAASQAILTVTIGKAAASVALGSSTPSATVGQAVTFTATVSGQSPGGTVSFSDGATPLCSNVALSGGTASCTTSALAMGSHSITATYSGDANNAGPTTSAQFTQTIAAAPTGSINLSGGSGAIVNGSTTPSAANGTDLGTTPVGTPLSHTFTIGNGGIAPTSIGLNAMRASANARGQAIIQAAGDITISGISSSNPAFAVSGGTGTVAAGGTATFTVTFNAAVVGPQTTTITISSNASNAASFTFAVGAAAAAAPAAVVPVPAPALSTWLLTLLAALFGGLGYRALRGARRIP